MLTASIVAASRQEDDIPQENGVEDGRITFDDTSEFVRNVTSESRAAPEGREKAASPPAASSSRQPVPVVVKVERGEDGQIAEDDRMDEDDESEDEDEGLAEMAAREGLSLEEYRIKVDGQMKEIANVMAEAQEVSCMPRLSQVWTRLISVQSATAGEPVVGSGVAGVLSILRNQGALSSHTTEDEEREKVQKQKDLWLADYRRRMAQREVERIQARGGNKDQAQRDWEAKVREQTEARDALEVYKNYKPDINIVYHDEFGRRECSSCLTQCKVAESLAEMTPKEAWKSLSHKFQCVQVSRLSCNGCADIRRSGKTSGRMKTEKRLKRIAEEGKQATMGSGDTPLGMSNAFSRRQQKTGQAHMVLTAGNRQ